MKSASVPTLAALVALSAAAAGPAMAQSDGDWLFRVGAGYVSPDTSNNDLVFEGIGLDGFNIDVDGQVGLVFNLTWFVAPNWGIELLAAAPFKHDVDGAGALEPLGKLGSTRHLPPVLSVQYHFAPERTIRPYVGAGVNYTFFFDESTSSNLHDGIVGTANGALGTDYAGGSTHLRISDSYGLALQAGFDIDISDRWFLNFDARWIDIDVDAALRTETFDPSGTDVQLNSAIDVDIDPWVLSTSIGFRF